MNKSELIAAVAERTDVSKATANIVLDALTDTIQAAVAAGEEISFVGFGKFVRVERPERQAYNPQTGGRITVPATAVPKFKPGKEFRDQVAARRRTM